MVVRDESLGATVVVKNVEVLHDPPEGNDFPTRDELRDLVEAAGFVVVQARDIDALADAPVDWQARADRVAATVAEAHGSDHRWTEANQHAGPMGRLLRERDVALVSINAVST